MEDDFQYNDTFAEVPYALADILERELEPKERVVWRGQPDVVRFVIRNIGVFLFGIPFFAFAVFWTTTAVSGFVRHGAMGKSAFPWFFILWGGMFVTIGASMNDDPRNRFFWPGRREARRATSSGNGGS